MTVMGIDPGLGACGVAVMEIGVREGEHYIWSGVVRTKKAKSKRVRMGDDNDRRFTELLEALSNLVVEYDPQFVVWERMTGAKSSQAMKCMQIAQNAVVATLFRRPYIRGVKVHAQDIKIVMTGNKQAEKEDVIAAVEMAFPGIGSAFQDYPAGQWSHMADAVGAIMAALPQIRGRDA